MAIGYLTGGLVHHLFANRASDDDCASRYFYPVFAVSYLTMIGSCWAWLGLADEDDNGSKRCVDSDGKGAYSSVQPKAAAAVVPSNSRGYMRMAVVATRLCLAFSAITIAAGSSWCQFSVKLYPGKTDPCPSSEQAPCDKLMMVGEGVFYGIWCITWYVVAVAFRPHCEGTWEVAFNWLAPVSISPLLPCPSLPFPRYLLTS
jgi:hypothetical protein